MPIVQRLSTNNLLRQCLFADPRSFAELTKDDDCDTSLFYSLDCICAAVLIKCAKWVDRDGLQSSVTLQTRVLQSGLSKEQLADSMWSVVESLYMSCGACFRGLALEYGKSKMEHAIGLVSDFNARSK